MFPLVPETPYSIALAADPRLAPTDYADDGIWRLDTDPAEPRRLPGLRSSFGGRARTVALAWEAPPAAGSPTVTALYGNYVRVELPLRDDIRATLEYLTPSSHQLLARLALHNVGSQHWPGAQFSVTLRAETADGSPAAWLFWEKSVRVRCGEDLALELTCDHPGRIQAHAAVYALAGLAPGDQYALAFSLSYGRPRASPFAPFQQTGAAEQPPIRSFVESFVARAHQLNAGIPTVHTGDPTWDAAIACAYAMGLRCYVGPGAQLPHPSFVFARSEEHGWSPAGDGSDHSWLWNGQVATEAYLSCPIVAACDPALAQGIIRNYLALQQPGGTIEWKPGLAGQREDLECIPLLAAIARIVYEHSGDAAFVAEAWPGLVRHIRRWLGPAHDRDGDGFPEWTSTIHSAFDDCPSFVPWQPWGQGLSIQQAECPDLGAYLFRECRDLLALAEVLAGKVPRADLDFLAHAAESLRAQVESLWSAGRAIYRYRDRDSHACPAGGLIWQGGASAAPRSWHEDSCPKAEGGNRVVVQVAGPPVDDVLVVARGHDAAGQPIEERFDRARFGWWSADPRRRASTSSEARFATLEGIVVAGLTREHTLRVSWASYTREDQTLLLPLWAGIPGAERAAQLVGTITDPARFWRPFGIPNCSAEDAAYSPNNRGGSGGVWMMWNTMLGEGLCRYGFYAQAWELFGRIMAAIVGRLQAEKCFREAYDNDSGLGIGARDYLWGTVPLHLLTLLGGAQIRSARELRLWHTDLGGRTITLRRLGVAVERQGDGARISWPDGSVEEVTLVPGQAPIVITTP
jgi:hypothetical protein